MLHRFNISLALLVGLTYASTALSTEDPKASSHCPSVKDFKKMLDKKHNPEKPFQPITDDKGRPWKFMHRFKTTTIKQLDDLIIEPHEQNTTLPLTATKARTCTYVAKDKEGNHLDEAKIVLDQQEASQFTGE